MFSTLSVIHTIFVCLLWYHYEARCDTIFTLKSAMLTAAIIEVDLLKYFL